MELIILGHVIGDFYLQIDKTVARKKKSIVYMLGHCLLYTVVTSLIFFVLSENINIIIQIAASIFLSHLGVDLLRRYANTKFSRYEYMIFLLDQVVHILILIIIFYAIRNNRYNQLSRIHIVGEGNVGVVIRVALAALICWKPAAIFISLVFKIIPKTIAQAEVVKEKDAKTSEKAEKDNMNNLEAEAIKIGAWIGILEREIILFLALLGQYAAIGFVLTAKSLARFKQLEDKAFAEKYLVGTLLSALIAILSIFICSI